MAKKRRKKKKTAATSSKRRKKKVVRKASAAGGKKKTKKKVSRKSTKRRKKRVSAAPASKVRKTRKKSRKKAASKRRKARRVTHSHSANTRHFKKGSSFKFKKKVGRGKNKMTVSGRVKVNPYRRNPMKKLGAQMKTYLGLDGQEMTALGLGGFAVPVLNGLAGKFAPTVVSKINEFVGPQATGSVLPIIGAIILNAAAEHGVKSGQAHKGLKLAGEGLAAAGIIGLAISLSQTYIAPALGMSGMGDVRFTPTMRGMGIVPQMGDVRFTPKAMNGMGDVRFTPKAMNGMGEGADFGSADYGGNGGYTQSHKFSRADFGADFSSDSEADFLGEDGDLLSSSMN